MNTQYDIITSYDIIPALSSPTISIIQHLYENKGNIIIMSVKAKQNDYKEIL